MYVIFFLIGLFATVGGYCEFPTGDSAKLVEKLKERGIYNQKFTLHVGTSNYVIGICASANNPPDNAAIIQQENNVTYVLGQLDKVNLAGGDDWMLLTYENGTSYNNTCDNKPRSAAIIFVCGGNKNSTTVIHEHTNDNKACDYVFEFQGFGMCPNIPVEKKHLSGGAIFLIICLCLASVYLIGGFLYMRIKHGARGLDQIPNLEMWIRLGNFAADGCDYCCRCRRHTPRAGYFLDESAPDIRGDDDILAP